MKKLILIIFFFPVLINAQSFTGRPKYSIIAKRLGDTIGEIKVELFPKIAPKAVANFDSLVQIKFYDTTAFHRVIPGFMIQGGDPNSRHGLKSTWGYGDPSQQNIPAEFNPISHLRGILSAARDADINSANSQFFICVASATHLNNQYTAYGRAYSGMDIVDNIVSSPRDANDNPLNKIEMFITYIGSDDSIPEKPNLISPVTNSINIPESKNLTWSTIGDAILYTIELSKDPAFTTIYLKKDIISNSTVVNNLEPLTKYYWRVLANNGGNISAYSDTFNFTTTIGKPSLIYPADSAVAVSIDPMFSWSSVPSATAYRLQICKNSGFSSFVFNEAINDTNMQVNGLSPQTKYYWRVQSENDTVSGFYSVKRMFNTGSGVGIENRTSSFTDISLHPNPAIDNTIINYSVKEAGEAKFHIYDLMGRKVWSYSGEFLLPGEYSLKIDLNELKEGVYVLIMQKDSFIEKKKLVLIK